MRANPIAGVRLFINTPWKMKKKEKNNLKQPCGYLQDGRKRN